MKTIGRRDKVNLPDLELYEVDAKIDSGARSSSIHCHDIEVVRVDDREFLQFRLLDPFHPKYNEKLFRFEDFFVKKVKSSSGHATSRYFIKSRIELFGELIETEFNLSNRESMIFPVLLGRRLLRKRFIIDVSKKNLSYRQKNGGKKT